MIDKVFSLSYAQLINFLNNGISGVSRGEGKTKVKNIHNTDRKFKKQIVKLKKKPTLNYQD